MMQVAFVSTAIVQARNDFLSGVTAFVECDGTKAMQR